MYILNPLQSGIIVNTNNTLLAQAELLEVIKKAPKPLLADIPACQNDFKNTYQELTQAALANCLHKYFFDIG